jgi:hypothetical protein
MLFMGFDVDGYHVETYIKFYLSSDPFCGLFINFCLAKTWIRQV